MIKLPVITDEDVKGILDNCPECNPQSELECYTCFAHKVLDYKHNADLKVITPLYEALEKILSDYADSCEIMYSTIEQVRKALGGKG